jgi:hypothetical protein
VTSRSRRAPDVGHACDVVRREQRTEAAERVRRVTCASGQGARLCRSRGAWRCDEPYRVALGDDPGRDGAPSRRHDQRVGAARVELGGRIERRGGRPSDNADAVGRRVGLEEGAVAQRGGPAVKVAGGGNAGDHLRGAERPAGRSRGVAQVGRVGRAGNPGEQRLTAGRNGEAGWLRVGVAERRCEALSVPSGARDLVSSRPLWIPLPSESSSDARHATMAVRSTVTSMTGLLDGAAARSRGACHEPDAPRAREASRTTGLVPAL